jgi:hypothetical protein
MKAVMAVLFSLAAVHAYAAEDAPLGLPSSADLKAKAGLDDEQVKKVDSIYAEYKDKAAEAQKKVDAGEKKAKKEVQALKTEIIAKLRDVGKDDDQKKKIDEAMPAVKKKKADK